MAKKRKSRPGSVPESKPANDKFGVNETFDDSADEFYAGRDKILVDESPAAKRRRKIVKNEQYLQPSDEEVYEDDELLDQADDDEEEEDDDADAQASQHGEDRASDDEEGENWGLTRDDYYNADVIETEADALEEEVEARRLQQKQIRSMNDADFGFDELAWAGKDESKTTKQPSIEKLTPIQVAETATAEERLLVLKSLYPEMMPLAHDLVQLQPVHDDMRRKITEGTEHSTNAQGQIALLRLKVRTLAAYLAAIAMYFAVLTSAKDQYPLSPAELRNHSVMESILRCRTLWDRVKDLEVDQDHFEDVRANDDLRLPEAEKIKSPLATQANDVQIDKKRPGSKLAAKDARKAIKKPKIEPMLIQQSTKERPEKKQKASRQAELNNLLAQASNNARLNEVPDIGDEAPLTEFEVAEKAQKKKSLRFYTSQIAQKANKRGAASRDAGGDDDVPRKERIRDRQERIAREAEHRAKRTNQDLDAPDERDDDLLGTRMNEDENEYYDMLVSNSKQKKADKQSRADAYAEAARQGAQVYEEEQVGPDGKRKISYAIEKNKGLMPKRKKDVRNPRVKKRKKYDEKLKKLGSIRQVYKGGEGRGGYAGELTGIKTNVVKSVKL